MSSDHAQRLHEAFTKQAAAFEDSRLNRVFTQDAEWLLQRLECRADDLLLDVAAGTGHAARELAGRVRAAVAVDVTPAMLAAGARAAREAGIENVVFQLGDATRLPFVEESFDVVVSRFALHHMPDPTPALAEMARCLRPCGRLGIADMVSAEEPDVARAQNRLETARDRSHTRMLPVSELVARIEALGLSHTTVEAREIDRPLEPWFTQAQTDDAAAEAIRHELREEIAGGAATGFQPYERDGELRFCQTWASVTAVKPGP
jgi:ubiquinone/menaquinone biosynthesis C-methylase UbiE